MARAPWSQSARAPRKRRPTGPGCFVGHAAKRRFLLSNVDRTVPNNPALNLNMFA